MENTHIDALDQASFRNYVLSVLEDYSARELGHQRLREVVDEIIEAATDRLCLLGGKGKAQTDVDFIVQQYREYFAALYLWNHPGADANRVFNMLVRRGAYWAYVLQFYVAQANTNQQMRWVTSMSEQYDEENPVEGLVRKTRNCRAILNVLPEFTLGRKPDKELALKIIFGLEMRWTWLGQEAAIEILQIIPSIDIFKTFWIMFGDLSSNDSATLAVEIWLLAQLSSIQSQEYVDICNKVQYLLSQENTRSIALQSTFKNDLKVNLETCNSSEIQISLEKYYHQLSKLHYYRRRNDLQTLISFQNIEKQCELLLYISGLWWWNEENWPFLQEDVQLSRALQKIMIYPRIQMLIPIDIFKLSLPPYLYNSFNKTNSLNTPNKELVNSGGLYTEFLKNLVGAIQDSTNSDLDNRTRLLEDQLFKDSNYVWKTDYTLGPSILAFSSSQAWKEFKQEISDAFRNNPGWIAHSIDANRWQNLWICLLFHPDHWLLLVEENLVTTEDCSFFRNTPLGKILQIPKIPIDIFKDIDLVPGTLFQIPLHKIVYVVFKILEQEGNERVSKTEYLGEFLDKCSFQLVPLEEIEKLLYRANNLPLPPSIWVNAILMLCIRVTEINLDLLLDFWEKSEHLKPRFALSYKDEMPEHYNQFLERLLSNKRNSALRLAIEIAVSSKPNTKVQVYLRERLLAESSSYLSTDEVYGEFYYRTLLNLDPSLEEFSLWIQPMIIDQISKSPWLLECLSERFVNAVNPKYKLDSAQLRKQLSIFITNRCNYPVSIALGALEAILKIDETNLPVLEPKLWQQYFDE